MAYSETTGVGHKEGMPTVKGWQEWIDKKLRPWASLVCENFDIWIRANMKLEKDPPEEKVTPRRRHRATELACRSRGAATRPAQRRRFHGA